MGSLKFDYIVVGSGLAGLITAYHASKHGSVALISMGEIDSSSSYHAQGGVAAAISEEDSPSYHREDTDIAGRGLCEKRALDILVNSGVDEINWLISKGMEFDREDGEILLGLEGGHSKRRILHAGGDVTGKEITAFMFRLVADNSAISKFEYYSVIELLESDNRCYGVEVLNLKTEKRSLFEGAITVLATGGVAKVYTRSTNPYTSIGAGIAMAWRAGAVVRDMEFMQFHPSALHLNGERAFLVSEAVRGEGAHLVNQDGERFMLKYHPDAELAPRDVVAHAIYTELKSSDHDCVYLSLSHLDRDRVLNRFRGISKVLTRYGLDLAKDLIPVSPAAHYMVGGIMTGEHGETTVDGLYACGEVASSGVMGANRLASNSLLECLVFGRRVVNHSAKNFLKENIERGGTTIFNAGSLVDDSVREIYPKVIERLSEIMSQFVGVVRNREGLLLALEQIREVQLEFKLIDKEYFSSLIKDRLTLCTLIAEAALNRSESRGGHIREEFPKSAVEYKRHTLQKIDRELSLSEEIK